MLALSNRLNHLKIAYDLILIRFLRILLMKKRFLPKKGGKHPYHTTDDVMVMMAMMVDGSGCESKNSKEDNDSEERDYQAPGGGTWVFFGWVCAARDSKLAPRSKKKFP